jgi:hypothetical protein
VRTACPLDVARAAYTLHVVLVVNPSGIATFTFVSCVDVLTESKTSILQYVSWLDY